MGIWWWVHLSLPLFLTTHLSVTSNFLLTHVLTPLSFTSNFPFTHVLPTLSHPSHSSPSSLLLMSYHSYSLFIHMSLIPHSNVHSHSFLLHPYHFSILNWLLTIPIYFSVSSHSAFSTFPRISFPSHSTIPLTQLPLILDALLISLSLSLLTHSARSPIIHDL